MLRNRYIKWSFILICLIFFVSCSDDKGDVSGVDFTENFRLNSKGNILVECSKFYPKMGNQIHALMKTFEYNGMTYHDKVSLRFTQNIDLQNRTLVFYRWRQDGSGNYSADDSPLTFDVEYNGRIFTGYTNLSQSDSNSIPLTQMTITIHNLPISYQALQIAIFDTNGDIEFYADGLIPMYEAHPRLYNDFHANQNLLKGLHPYKSESSSTKPQEEFAQRSYQDFCF